jgi:hypothetical protein
MRTMTIGGLLLAAAAAAMPASADAPDYSACTFPETPPTVPDGGGATEQQMMDTGAAVKAYVDEAQKGLACLEAEKAKMGDTPMTEDERADYTARYDKAYDALSATAEAYNGAVRAFKAKNPG